MKKNILTLLILIAASGAYAQSTQKPAKRDVNSKRFGQSYEWHDGDQVKHVWLNPEVIALIKSDETSENELQKEFPSAKKLRVGRGGLKFWRVRGANSSTHSRIREFNVKSHDNASSSTGVSEVFHDGPVESTSARILPGGIVLGFPIAWSEKRCREWIAAKGHIIEHVIESSPNTYVVKSEPGLPTLEEANRLHATGDLVVSSPDWLIDVKSR